MTDPKIIAELRKIEAKHDGLLRPEDVVKAAQKESNPLHPYFEWDDSVAAHQHRLWQARMLIRVAVEVLPQTDEPTRVFVSLSGDRSQPGGGYRSLVTVLSDAEKQEMLLADALAEFRIFERKYKALKRLAPLFAAAKRIRREIQKRKVG